MSIILFIIILCVLIFVHELGHFLAAKRVGIRVDEFGVGFPPRLWSKKAGETEYSINAFPIGGFVKIFGEDPSEESIQGPDASRSFVHKSKWAQAAVVSAGVIFNLILAWIVISIGLMAGVSYSVDDSRYGSRVENPTLTIMTVTKGSPAETAGLKSGDKILSLASGHEVLENPHIESVQDFIASHSELSLSYQRGKDAETAIVHPQGGLVEGRPAIGISMDMAGILKLPFYEAIPAGFVMTGLLTGSTIVGVLDFFKNMFIGSVDLSGVSGPVGIVQVVSDASVLGWAHVLSLVAIISINLAIINLLPFPALDGGRLLFIVIEAIKGSPIKPAISNTANGIGFVLLIILMMVITYSDIAKIVQG